NAFVAGNYETVEAVSFFTAADNVDYTVKIFETFSGGELLNELSSESGTASYTGFHTIELSTAVNIDTGCDFYVYLELLDGGQPFGCTSDVPVLLGANYRVIVESSASPGESYYLNGATWTDLTTVDTTANFCMKALSNLSVGIEVEDGISSVLSLNPLYPNPFSAQVAIPFNLASPGFAEISVYDLSGRQIKTIARQEFLAGEHTVIWQGMDANNNPAASGVYFVRLWTEVGSATRQVMLIR
ncbi:MAG: T9SS type A sorting domain-containing protein, partial [Candidatus Aegiribacteria sp.]|nr:T9SS type A sorting domain-containing protein [Candidatus Aegiribacteria sp.]